MTEKARKQKWNTGCIPLLILYIIHGVFVTAYMGGILSRGGVRLLGRRSLPRHARLRLVQTAP